MTTDIPQFILTFYTDVTDLAYQIYLRASNRLLFFDISESGEITLMSQDQPLTSFLDLSLEDQLQVKREVYSRIKGFTDAIEAGRFVNLSADRFHLLAPLLAQAVNEGVPDVNEECS